MKRWWYCSGLVSCSSFYVISLYSWALIIKYLVSYFVKKCSLQLCFVLLVILLQTHQASLWNQHTCNLFCQFYPQRICIFAVSSLCFLLLFAELLSSFLFSGFFRFSCDLSGQAFFILFCFVHPQQWKCWIYMGYI